MVIRMRDGNRLDLPRAHRIIGVSVWDYGAVGPTKLLYHDPPPPWNACLSSRVRLSYRTTHQPIQCKSLHDSEHKKTAVLVHTAVFVIIIILLKVHAAYANYGFFTETPSDGIPVKSYHVLNYLA